jgi:hypothetical protein
MILLKELERDPLGPDAETFRTVVDEAIALCTADGGISGTEGGGTIPRPLTEGGQEAWAFVRKLRAVAWTRAGLDPDVVMTREEVVRLVMRRGEAVTSSQISELPLPLDATRGGLEAELYASTEALGGDLGGNGEANMNLSWSEWDSILGNFEYQGI